MNKFNLCLVMIVGVMLTNTAYAERCKKTLMGSDCVVSEKGTSSHMRGNAVENAKASNELKEAKRKAKAKAISVGAAGKANAK